jgi:hypothetical protein
MLKTNGSVAAREEYSNSVGSLVIIPARTPSDRVPVGTLEFSITYRFAGVHQPGVAVPRPIKCDEKQEAKIAHLEQQISSLTNLLS